MYKKTVEGVNCEFPDLTSFPNLTCHGEMVWESDGKCRAEKRKIEEKAMDIDFDSIIRPDGLVDEDEFRYMEGRVNDEKISLEQLFASYICCPNTDKEFKGMEGLPKGAGFSIWEAFGLFVKKITTETSGIFKPKKMVFILKDKTGMPKTIDSLSMSTPICELRNMLEKISKRFEIDLGPDTDPRVDYLFDHKPVGVRLQDSGNVQFSHIKIFEVDPEDKTITFCIRKDKSIPFYDKYYERYADNFGRWIKRLKAWFNKAKEEGRAIHVEDMKYE